MAWRQRVPDVVHSSSESVYFDAWLGAYLVTTGGLGILGYRKIPGKYYRNRKNVACMDEGKSQ